MKTQNEIKTLIKNAGIKIRPAGWAKMHDGDKTLCAMDDVGATEETAEEVVRYIDSLPGRTARIAEMKDGSFSVIDDDRGEIEMRGDSRRALIKELKLTREAEGERAEFEFYKTPAGRRVRL